MIRFHRDRGGDVTVGCIPVPLADVKHFGIMQVGDDDRVVSFLEKPKAAEPIPGEPRYALGSMGIYVFNTRLLFELLCEDAAVSGSDHDFGKNIIPRMIDAGHKVFAHRFRDENRKAVPYWRDVGTLDAYYQANMDLVAARGAGLGGGGGPNARVPGARAGGRGGPQGRGARDVPGPQPAARGTPV